jgi:radical SAM protein with 4Fe4S-binding SPASM domain
MEWHKPPFKLKEIKIEVTHDCMLHCVHCSSVAKEISGRSMDWTSCKKLLDEAYILGTRTIAFSGGEPLLWAHINEAVAKAAQSGAEVYIYTSANVPNAEKKLEELYHDGLSRVMFSIFGADATYHEKITNIPGSFNKTIATAIYCANIGLTTEFHFVPLAYNYNELPEIADKGRHMGVKRISVLRLVPQGRGAKTNEELSNEQNIELRKTIKDLRDHGHDIRLGSPYNFLMLREKPQCCAGIDRLTVGPDLRIFPCDAFKHILPSDIGASSDYSSLATHSLAECWEKSPYLNVVREYLMADFAPECGMCAKLEVCLSGCMAQKFYVFGELKKCPDPMCLLKCH